MAKKMAASLVDKKRSFFVTYFQKTLVHYTAHEIAAQYTMFDLDWLRCYRNTWKEVYNNCAYKSETLQDLCFSKCVNFEILVSFRIVNFLSKYAQMYRREANVPPIGYIKKQNSFLMVHKNILVHFYAL